MVSSISTGHFFLAEIHGFDFSKTLGRVNGHTLLEQAKLPDRYVPYISLFLSTMRLLGYGEKQLHPPIAAVHDALPDLLSLPNLHTDDIQSPLLRTMPLRSSR